MKSQEAIKGIKVCNEWGVENQFVISVNGVGTFFQSYSSIIAAKTPEGIILDAETWDYSVTTGKYRNLFLGEKKSETERKIKAGIYKLENLNQQKETAE